MRVLQLQARNLDLEQRLSEEYDKRAEILADARESEIALAEHRTKLRNLAFELHCAKEIYTGGRGWQQRHSVPAHRRIGELACLQDLALADLGLASVPVPSAGRGVFGGAPTVAAGDSLFSLLLSSDCSRMVVSSYNVLTGEIASLRCKVIRRCSSGTEHWTAQIRMRRGVQSCRVC